MEILIADHQKKVAVHLLRLHRMVKAVLSHERVVEATLSVVFVTSQKIKALNKKFLKRNYATDVLAFDFTSPVGRPVRDRSGRRKSVHTARLKRSISGEIIVSTDAALKYADGYQTSFSNELCLYVIHGILHLIGYNDTTAAQRKRMHKRQKLLLDYLGARSDKVFKKIKN